MTKPVLHFAVLALVVMLMGACAALPPQVRPASPDLFVGNWEGTWTSSLGYTGSVEAAIEPRGNVLQIQAKYTNAVVPGFVAEAKFVNGELIVDQPISMTLHLHGNDRLGASYYNERNNSRGTWSLTRVARNKTTAVEKPAAVVTEEESAKKLAERLVAGSPWDGTFGPQPVGKLTIVFTQSGGTIKGELIYINAGTASPGPLSDLRVEANKVSFRTPGNNVYVELTPKDSRLEGYWRGTRSGWISLSPSTK